MNKILFFGAICLALFSCEEPEITTSSPNADTSSETMPSRVDVMAALDKLPYVLLDNSGEFDRSQLNEETLYKVDNYEHSVVADDRLYLFKSQDVAEGFSKIWSAYHNDAGKNLAANSRAAAGIPAIRFYKHAKYENGRTVFPVKSKKFTINGFKDFNRYLRVQRPGTWERYSAPYQLHDHLTTTFSHLGKEIKSFGSMGLWEYDLMDTRYEQLPRNEQYRTYPYINNQISGLDINSKGANTTIKVVLYQKKDFRGRSSTYIVTPSMGTQSLPVVSKWMNDRTSSIAIHWSYNYDPTDINDELCSILNLSICNR